MPIQAFVQTMACGATLASTAVELVAGARNVSVFVGSATSASDILFKVSADGTNYFNLKFSPSSGVVAVGNVTIGSAVTQAAVRVPELAGQRYVKLEYTSAMTANNVTHYYLVEY